MTKRKTDSPVKSYAPQPNGSDTTITVIADNLTWEDMYTIMLIDKDSPMTKETIVAIRNLFERVVVGGAAAVPIGKTQAVIEKIGGALGEMGNPKNSGPA